MPAKLFWSVLAGALGTLVSIGFRTALFELDHLVLGHGGGLVAIAMQLLAWQRILVPSLGGLLAGALPPWARNRAPHNAPSNYMEDVALGNGHIPVHASLVRSGSSLLSIASGGSIGRKGSMVQLAALGASLLGRLLHLRTMGNYFNNAPSNTCMSRTRTCTTWASYR